MNEGQLQAAGYTPASGAPANPAASAIPLGNAGNDPPPPDPREVAQQAAEAGHGAMMGDPATQKQMPHNEPRQAPVIGTEPPKDAPPPAESAAPDELELAPRRAVPQSSPVRRIPGGPVKASWQVTPGLEIPESAKEDYAADDRAEIGEAYAANIAAKRDEIMAEREKAYLDQQAELDKARSRRAGIDRDIRAKQELISRRDKEAEGMKPQSAKEVMASKGIMGRFLAAVAMTVGGYMQGLQGRQNNPGLDMINDAIRSEVDDQRQAYDDALAEGKTARNDYAEAIKLYGSPEEAEQDLTMRRFAIVENMIKNHGEAIGTEQGKAAAHMAAAEARNDRANTATQLAELGRTKVVENWVQTPDRYVGGAPAMPKDAMERAVRLPNGEYVFARTGEGAKVAQRQLKVDSSLADAANRIIYLRTLPGAKTDPKLRGQIEGAAANLFMGLKEGANLGTLDKGAMDFRSEWTGDATALMDLGGADAKLSEIVRAAKNRVNDTVRYDLHPDPRSLAPYANARPPSKPNE